MTSDGVGVQSIDQRRQSDDRIDTRRDGSDRIAVLTDGKARHGMSQRGHCSVEHGSLGDGVAKMCTDMYASATKRSEWNRMAAARLVMDWQPHRRC